MNTTQGALLKKLAYTTYNVSYTMHMKANTEQISGSSILQKYLGTWYGQKAIPNILCSTSFAVLDYMLLTVRCFSFKYETPIIYTRKIRLLLEAVLV